MGKPPTLLTMYLPSLDRLPDLRNAGSTREPLRVQIYSTGPDILRATGRFSSVGVTCRSHPLYTLQTRKAELTEPVQNLRYDILGCA